MENFDRLEMQAKGGLLKLSDVGSYIAQNLKRDPDSKVDVRMVADLLARDLANVLTAAGETVKVIFSTQRAAMADRILEEKLTKLLGEDNLVGSSGEFGLLFAFLANSPRTQELDGEPALSLDDVRGIFVDKRLPDGWESWRKSRGDWVGYTAHLVRNAHKEFQRLSGG
jgi:hypothetical protein